MCPTGVVPFESEFNTMPIPGLEKHIENFFEEAERRVSDVFEGVESGLTHVENGMTHFEKGFEHLEGGIDQHIDRKDDGADVGTVLQVNLEKVETALDNSVTNGLAPVERGFENSIHHVENALERGILEIDKALDHVALDPLEAVERAVEGGGSVGERSKRAQEKGTQSPTSEDGKVWLHHDAPTKAKPEILSDGPTQALQPEDAPPTQKPIDALGNGVRTQNTIVSVI